VKASAPGKLFLLGEYAVLEGASALVAAIDRRALVTLQAAAASGILVSAPEIGIDRASCTVEHGQAHWRAVNGPAQRRLALLTVCFEHAAQATATPSLPDLEIRIDSRAFVADGAKIGIGSSAAIAVALIGGLLAFTGCDVASASGRRRALVAALEAHAVAQGGRGSGADVAAAACGGVIRYRRGCSPQQTEDPQPMVRPERLRMAAVSAGQAASTPAMLADLDAFRNARPGSWTAHFEHLAHLAEAGCAAFASADIDALLEVVAGYHRALDELGRASGLDIVSPAHHAIAEVASCKGVAYKPSGAGGGDLGLLFGSGDDRLEEARRRLDHAGFPVVSFAIDERGLDVRRRCRGTR
jgi:phosphomevalonate kinase